MHRIQCKQQQAFSDVGQISLLMAPFLQKKVVANKAHVNSPDRHFAMHQIFKDTELTLVHMVLGLLNMTAVAVIA